MKRVCVPILLVVMVLSLVVGGILGFFLGVASVKEGKEFLEGFFEQERMVEIEKPKGYISERFTFLYPSNWNIDKNNENYDPNHNFIIESPGAASVIFLISEAKTEPEENIKLNIEQYKKIISNPSITRFEKYGQLVGKGAILNGIMMGIDFTVKIFSAYQDNLTVVIIQFYPDGDLKYIKAGLELIENSFTVKE